MRISIPKLLNLMPVGNEDAHRPSERTNETGTCHRTSPRLDC